MEKSGHFPAHCAQLAIELLDDASKPGIECAAFALGFLSCAYMEDTADTLKLDSSQDARDRLIKQAKECRTMPVLQGFQAFIVGTMRPWSHPVD
jgi:hypothetical protein